MFYTEVVSPGQVHNFQFTPKLHYLHELINTENVHAFIVDYQDCISNLFSSVV